MDYQQTLDYMFASLPMFQRIGGAAYKEGLETTEALDRYFGHPHRKFRTIHVAGTNGKGSVSTILASVMQRAGYRVGLYTSPHLKDFRERIRVDGEMIPQQEVVDFVGRHRAKLEELEPSFFEMTVAMALDYFDRRAVDVAILEVGMGGRLDSTNIVTPLLSIITNIGFDHTQFLGDTLGKIAGEKAGIIKPEVPVVVGETDPETMPVFAAKADECGSPIFFADQRYRGVDFREGTMRISTLTDGYRFSLSTKLSGNYQLKNIPTALTALDILDQQGTLKFTRADIEAGIADAHIAGRWQTLGQSPLTICDTGHNEAGIRYAMQQIAEQTYGRLYIIIGVAADKDLSKILPLLPTDAHYIFTRADIPRAMEAAKLEAAAADFGLRGECVEGVAAALERARSLASAEDMIFVGGSIFVVAEVV